SRPKRALIRIRIISMIVCPYLGTTTIGLRTYTTTYAPFNGPWEFNNHALYAMEFRGFINAANKTPIGFYSRTMDIINGYTTISVGDNNPANENVNFQPLAWDGKKIAGFCSGGVGTFVVNCVNYPGIPGHSYSMPFMSRFGFDIGAPPNTQFPNPDTGANWYAPDGGIYGSSDTNLVQFGHILHSNDLAHTGHCIVGSAFDWVVGGINYHSLTYWRMKNPADATDRRILRISQTMTVNALGPFSVTFQEPEACSIVMDTLLITSNGEYTISPNGYFLVFGTIITLGNKTLNGFGVFILPDFSGYTIIEFLPADSNSALWYTLAGSFRAKLDPAGALWIKNVNNHTTLFVSAGSVLKLLPIFFPVPLADTEERDPVLRLMRST
ncbi:MAG TPA: hypothetical protein VIY48_08020, partial [Candidatus Paceibacterota bacterium]